MFGWLQRTTRKRDDETALANGKRRMEYADVQLEVRLKQLKVDAVQRVVENEPDPVTALEVVSLATHKGRYSPPSYTRRAPQQSPLEALAMTMLTKRLEEDPTDALERILERRERLEDAADRLSGGRRYEDGETGNTVVDALRAVSNSPLGEAIGAVFAQSAQQRVAAAAAASGATAQSVVPVVDSGGAGPTGEAAAVAPGQTPAAISGPRPVSFRVGMALRALKAMSPADRARWILSQAEANRQLAELVGPVLSAEPSAVQTILEAFVAEAQASGDPTVLEWVPVVAFLLEDMTATLQTHQVMRALAFEDADGGDGDEIIVGDDEQAIAN